MAHALVTLESERMQVRVRNISNSPLVVYPYQKLGKLSDLDSSEVFDDCPDFQLIRGDAVLVQT